MYTDITQACRAALLADSDVTAAVDDRVYLTAPDPFILPSVRVNRIGGARTRAANAVTLVGPDTADLSVTVWAATITEADRAMAAIRDLFARLATVDVTVTAVREMTAPAVGWDTTRTPPTPQVTATFAVTHR